jgi:solute carrier family 25 S-adenosylmethionine transporter 26
MHRNPLLFFACLEFAHGGSPGGAASSLRRLNVDLRYCIAGGIAGGITNGLLHPFDTAKTLRQGNPVRFRSTAAAFADIVRQRGLGGLYGGVHPAMLGAIPSSALYFGTYESVKRRLKRAASQRRFHARVLPLIPMVAAASGNAASSLVFVPKEFVKQQMQAAHATGRAISAAEVLRSTLLQEGIGGLFAGYRATLFRNVPSTVIRFSVFEELKLRFGASTVTASGRIGLLGAGAASGILASALATPMDVLKTRLALGTLKRQAGILKCLKEVVATEGTAGLFVGIKGRMVWSVLFNVVGFTSFEFLKGALFVDEKSLTKGA